jgi:lysyl-tRNA synthetase class 1
MTDDTLQIIVPKWIQDILADYETRTPPFNEVEIADSLRIAKQHQGDLSDQDWAAFLAEHGAYLLFESRSRKVSPWGTYFAPMATGSRPDGTEWRSPDIADFNEQTVLYWQERAQSVKSPVMKRVTPIWFGT